MDTGDVEIPKTFDEALIDAFSTDDKSMAVVAGPVVPLAPIVRIDAAPSVPYAIASQADRLSESRRRSKLTPEPTDSTLIDLRYLRLVNHKAGRRPDEIARVIGEFPNGEYNAAFNKVNAGRDDVELLPVPAKKHETFVEGVDAPISRELFEEEFYRYAIAGNALILIRADSGVEFNAVAHTSLGELLLAVKREHDVVAHYHGEAYAFLLFNVDHQAAQKFCEDLLSDTSDFTVSIGCVDTAVGEDNLVEVMDRADRAMYLAAREKNCIKFDWSK